MIDDEEEEDEDGGGSCVGAPAAVAAGGSGAVLVVGVVAMEEVGAEVAGVGGYAERESAAEYEKEEDAGRV